MRVLAVSVWLMLMLVTAYAVFHISFQVEAMEARLSELNRDIREEQEASHVLAAEWAFLTRPDRLGTLARDLLPGFQPAAAGQLAGFEDIPMPLPEEPLPPGPAAEAADPNVIQATARRSE